MDPSKNARTEQVSFYMTPDDARSLKIIAASLGFRGVSQMCAAIFERLLVGGFSPLVFAKVAFQLHKLAEERGGMQAGFYFGTRPLPAMPDHMLTPKESKEILSQLREEMAKEATTANKPQTKQKK